MIPKASLKRISVQAGVESISADVLTELVHYISNTFFPYICDQFNVYEKKRTITERDVFELATFLKVSNYKHYSGRCHGDNDQFCFHLPSSVLKRLLKTYTDKRITQEAWFMLQCVIEEWLIIRFYIMRAISNAAGRQRVTRADFECYKQIEDVMNFGQLRIVLPV
jgi:histone H3/H4